MKFAWIFVVLLLVLLIDVSVYAQGEENLSSEDTPTEQFLPSSLLEAVVRKDIDAVRQAVENGESVDIVNENGWSAARFAVTLNDMNLLRTLIELGIDLNNPDRDGVTPLMAAAGAADKEMVEILLAGNAAPLQQSNDGNTAFNFATQSGRHLVAYMIAEAAALHAIDGDNLDLLLDSIRLGAYVNIRNVAGWTPLMLSCARGNVDGVRELLSFGADPNRTENDGWTALHFAAAGGHDDIVELLLNNNADPHIRSVDGRLPREIALSAEHQTVADMLPQA